MQVQNLQGFKRHLKTLQSQMKERVKVHKAFYVRKVFRDLIEHTPQYTGDLVQNWFIETSTRTQGYEIVTWADTPQDTWSTRFEIYARGDDPGVSNTAGRELPKLLDMKWDAKIRLANYAQYALKVEANVDNYIREVNLLNGRVAMKAYILEKYK